MDKHAELDSDQQSDSGDESRESGGGSSDESGEEEEEDEEELDKETEELNRRAQMTTEELMVIARARTAEGNKFCKPTIQTSSTTDLRCSKWSVCQTAQRSESVRNLPWRPQ